MAEEAGNDGPKSGKDSKDVQYFDSDFSFEEHAADCSAQYEKAVDVDGDGDGNDCSSTAPSDAVVLTEDHDDLLPQSQSKFWDAFHSNHSAGNFYKPRRYLTKSFPCIMQYFEKSSAEDSQMQTNNNRDRILLEIGCGSGSSCTPIMKQCGTMECSGDGDDVKQQVIILACDSSPVAVETTIRFVEKIKEKELDINPGQCNTSFGAFVADPSLTEGESSVSFLQGVKSAYENLALKSNDLEHDGGGVLDRGVAGIVLMVFVLSAVTPSRAGRFLEQVYQTTKPGGKVCFRDYGVYDLPMLRFNPTAACKSSTSDDPIFVRGEGTIARFFSVGTTRELFELAGFITVELRYCTVFNHNRKTGQKLKRVFVHGVFEKPI